MERQEQYAWTGPGPRIKDQTAWLDFISFITDNILSTVDLHHCQIISSLFIAQWPRAMPHRSSGAGRDAWLMDAESDFYLFVCYHLLFASTEKDPWHYRVFVIAVMPKTSHPTQDFCFMLFKIPIL